MCVGVTLWLGWGGVVSVCRLKRVCWCYVVVWLGWCGIRMQAEAVRSNKHKINMTKCKIVHVIHNYDPPFLKFIFELISLIFS